MPSRRLVPARQKKPPLPRWGAKLSRKLRRRGYSRVDVAAILGYSQWTVRKVDRYYKKHGTDREAATGQGQARRRAVGSDIAGGITRAPGPHELPTGLLVKTVATVKTARGKDSRRSLNWRLCRQSPRLERGRRGSHLWGIAVGPYPSSPSHGAILGQKVVYIQGRHP